MSTLTSLMVEYSPKPNPGQLVHAIIRLQRCAVMLSVYRLDDHLWHVNKIDTFGKGSHRDYRTEV